jgi:hypothetical protein
MRVLSLVRHAGAVLVVGLSIAACSGPPPPEPPPPAPVAPPVKDAVVAIYTAFAKNPAGFDRGSVLSRFYMSDNAAIDADCAAGKFSALAEAEVEYEDKTSPAIDVAFRVVDGEDLARRIGVADAARVPASVVIWTTTPWTLPANEAVTLRAEFEYVLVEVARETGTERLLLAEGLMADCLLRYGLPAVHEVARF